MSRRLSFTDKERQYVLNNIGTKTVIQIAKELGRSDQPIYKYLNDEGICIDGCRKRAERNVSCNIHYFDQWSPNMAYILGFAFADGSIYKNTLSIIVTQSDEAVLNFIKNEVGSDKKIRRYNHNGNRGTKPYSVFCINSRVAADRLRELGIKESKTYLDEPFPNMPDNMVPHFVRGFFDGDGCAHVAKKGACHVKLIGTPKFIMGMVKRLSQLAGMVEKQPLIQQGKRATWAIVYWTNPNDIRKFYRFIYENADFCYARKKDTLKNWLERPDRKEINRIPWTDEQRKQLMVLRKTMTRAAIAETIGRTLCSVNGMIHIMKIRKCGFKNKH